MADTTNIKAIRLDPIRIADRLNDRFVSMVRAVDTFAKRSVNSVLGAVTGGDAATPRAKVEGDRPGSADAGSAAKADAAGAPAAALSENEVAELTQHTRAQLCKLHLRVGECIYEAEKHTGDSEPIKRQLAALLDEIERVEDVLKRLGSPPKDDEPAELSDEIHDLFTEPDRPINKE